MSDVIKTGEPLFIANLEERNRRYPTLADEGQESHALVVVPLALEGRVFGAMSLSFDHDVEFEAERREMKVDARAAGGAGARPLAPLRGRAALRERMTFLAEASELLSSSLDYNHTLTQVAQLSVPGLADWCAIDMVGPNGEIERLAVAHEDPAKVRWAYELQERYPPDPDAPTGVPQVLRTGEPEFFPSSSRRSCWTRRSATTRSCAGSSTSWG